jgi:CheY-like chemotaxis protein
MKRNRILLLVDDDDDDRMFFRDALKEVDQNIQFISANNGQMALQLLNNPENKLPDFIFLDLRMPGYNGKKCLFEIKNNERLKHIPVIVYTTSKSVEESKELKAMGASRFVSKPNNTEEIYYLISVVLEEYSTEYND